MNAFTDKTRKKNIWSVANAGSRKQGNAVAVFQSGERRPETIAQRKFQEIVDNSPRVKQLRAYQAIANQYTAQVSQRKRSSANIPGGNFEQRKRENNTGLPDNLKAGIESLSGYAMDDVKVHFNSERPAQLHAHAYAQGTEIHLRSGQEKHLPHEAWHVVQQKQRRVNYTSYNRGTGVNDQPALEHEAEVMGKKASMHTLPAKRPGTLSISAPLASALQLIVVDENDIGKTYEIRPAGASANTQGILKQISGGGWYAFEVSGKPVNVRGQDNIIREITPAGSNPLAAILSRYNVSALSDTILEFTVNDVANTYHVSPQQALQMIADSFGRDPRTIRIHYPFGSKTIAKGNEAFSNPSETDKLPQAMISYRMADYPKHKKVGKDYDDWAEELSDSEEPETDRREFAGRMNEYLTQPSPTDDFMDLSGAQRASLGGIITATQISDRLRTDKDSEVTPMEFTSQIDNRSKGIGTLHSIFGQKSTSTFLPARSGGSHQQRTQLSTYEAEVRANARLMQNNCLINAICQAAFGRNANIAELVMIRSNLGNVGQMLAATQATVNTIRQTLLIPNPITVRYVLGSGGMNETLNGAGTPINIYHTNGDHFQHTAPPGRPYDMS